MGVLWRIKVLCSPAKDGIDDKLQLLYTMHSFPFVSAFYSIACTEEEVRTWIWSYVRKAIHEGRAALRSIPCLDSSRCVFV